MIYCFNSNILLNYHSRQHVFCLNSNNLNCIQTLTKSYLFEKFLSVMRCWCLGAYTGIIGAKVALLSNFQRKDPVSKSALMDQWTKYMFSECQKWIYILIGAIRRQFVSSYICFKIWFHAYGSSLFLDVPFQSIINAIEINFNTGILEVHNLTRAW